METITINGTAYDLDIKRAEELGVLTKVKQPLRFEDLKNGDIFKWRYKNNKLNTRVEKDGWFKKIYIMIDKDSPIFGQVVEKDTLSKQMFENTYRDVYAIYDVSSEKWIETK